MITSDNSFFYLFRKSIKNKDFNLLKEISFNEIAKIIIYQKEQIIDILKNNNINYNEGDCIIESIFNNIDKIKNDISKLIFDRNKIKEYTEHEFKILNDILQSIENKDYNIIRNKILTYKELLEKKYNVDDYLDKNNNNNNNKKILLLSMISIISLVIFIAYKKIKNNKNNEISNNADNNYINSI